MHGSLRRKRFKRLYCSTIRNLYTELLPCLFQWTQSTSMPLLRPMLASMPMPLPGHLPNYRDFTVMLLPSDKTRLMVHNLYLEAAQGSGFPSVSYSKFTQLWADLCLHINIMKPSSDMCPLCQQNMTRLGRSSNLTEDGKSQRF